MTAPLPISLEVRAPYETAVKYAKGSALALTAVALTTLVPPVAGVLGLALTTKTVFVLTSAAFVTVLTSGGLGLFAAINYRIGYQALFEETAKGAEGHSLMNINPFEKELKEAIDAKDDFERKIASKQDALDKLNEELEALRKKYEEAALKQEENDRQKNDKISSLLHDLEKAKEKECDLSQLIKSKESDLEKCQKALEEKGHDNIALKDKMKRGLEEKEEILKKLNSLKEKERSFEELEKNNLNLKREIADLKKTASNQKSSQKRQSVHAEDIIKAERDELREKLKKAEEKSKAQDIDKEDIEKRRAVLEEERDQLKEKLSKADEKVRSLEKEIDKLNPLSLAQKQAKELKEKEAIIADLRSDIEELKKSHERALKLNHQNAQIEIDSLTRKLKRIEEEIKSNKQKLSSEIERLEKELQNEKKGQRSNQANYEQEKNTLEADYKEQISKKEKEIESLNEAIADIKKENERIAKEKEEALKVIISNIKGDMGGLQEELAKYRDQVEQMAINASLHESVKEELSLSKKRINDFLEEQKKLREVNRQLREEKENNIELFELKTRLEDAERLNEGYVEENRGKVSRIQALERQVAELEKELAHLKGQPLDTPSLKKEPSRWSVRKKELEFESKMPKEIVNKGEDSKQNTYHANPTHRLDVASVLKKFKSQEACDDLELMTLFKEFQNNYKVDFKKDREKKAVDPKWEFQYSRENLRKYLLDLSEDNELQSSTLLNKSVHNFVKIGIYYLESDTLADLFSFIKPLSTLESLNSMLEGYILRVQKGHGIAHDTTLEAVISCYVSLCERFRANDFDHAFLFEAVFILIYKNSDIVAKNLMQLDRLGLIRDGELQSLYSRCLSHFQHPDTNSLCQYLKERVEKIEAKNA